MPSFIQLVSATTVIGLAACASPAPQRVQEPEATPIETETPDAPDPGKSDETSSDDGRVGRFVRYDLITADPGKAAVFYRGLFGWELEPKEDGAIRVRGDVVGTVHLASNVATLKTGWIAYIAVTDVDDVAVDVVGNGGEIVRAATATSGSREAIVRGPTGGAFGLRALVDADEARDLGERAGDIYWPQLWTSDLPRALAFFQVIGEYTSVEYRFGTVRYQVFKVSNGAPVGVTVNTPTGQRNRWLPFVRVDDVDETVRKAKTLGAKVVTKPREIAGIGRVASLSTPSGGVIGIIRPVEAETDLDD